MCHCLPIAVPFAAECTAGPATVNFARAQSAFAAFEALLLLMLLLLVLLLLLDNVFVGSS